MNTSIKRILTVLIIVLLSLAVGFGIDLAWESIERRLYPRSYEEIIADASAEFDVPAELLYATVKVESDFDPEAVSKAGAVGLMQMVPDTFLWLTGDEHLGEHLPQSRLTDPEVSIRYGTYYLAYLYRYFDYNWHHAIAAYNGGMGNVAKWLENPEYIDDEGNLKHIPFSETRAYVKKVEKAQEMYLKFYNHT